MPALLLAACGGERPAPSALPRAEFLVAAGDSTYWVRSSGEGMRVRSAPLLLTRVDGRTYELFVTEEGAEYADASFSTVRLWSRDIAGRDSVALVADSTVMGELARWRRRHPREEEVDPADETLTEDPSTVVSDEVDIVDIHGPYVTVEHLLDVDIAGGASHRHQGRRFVVDVRSGARVPLAALVGAAEAARALAAAPPALRQLTDSIRTAAAGGDERARAAADVLGSFRFDSAGFGITDVDRQPALAFMVPGTGAEGEALALHLPPIPVTPPAWWAAVRATLPTWAPDSSRLGWTPGGYHVVARPSGEEAVALALQPARAGESAAAASAAAASAADASAGASTAREWPIATVPRPVYQFLQLDAPPLGEEGRRALSRAFDLSAAGGLVERAAWRPRGPSGAPRLPRALFRAAAR